jgi:hypothetical protein
MTAYHQSLSRRTLVGALISCLGPAPLWLSACDSGQPKPVDTAVRVQDSAVVAPPQDTAPAATQAPQPIKVPPRKNLKPLSPRADSIAQWLVFAPTNQTWFVAAARGKRLLIDIGRVDVEVRRDPARLAAYKEAVAARAPLTPGTRFRLRGPWGADDATLTGYDTWNGRIVATVETAPRVDSLARVVEPLPVTAELTDSTRAAATDTCERVTIEPLLAQRLTVIRDSIEQAMRLQEIPPYERFQKSLRPRSTQVIGCFGTARAVLFVTLWAANYEWARERAVLVSDSGAVTPIRVNDNRFKAHEAIYALDGDGDGIDDVAARGQGDRVGGTVVLRIVEGKKQDKKLERLAGGFAWETR